MTTSATIPEDLELLIKLDRHARRSLQRQLLEQLRQAILQGQLAPGRRLPATRPLASALGIARNVVVGVYDELAIEGYLTQRQGSGAYVTSDLPTLSHAPRPTPAGTPRWLRPPTEPPASAPSFGPDAIVFRLGVPTMTPFPLSVWRTVWREVTERLPPPEYGSVVGDPDLRATLAAYLHRARGVTCGPDDIIITTSAAQALDLIAQATLTAGNRVGFEEPGYHLAREALLVRGAQIVPIPVDNDGIQVDRLPTGPDAPLLVYVTPSHQFPLAARLPITRRIALLEWARANNSLIIEDDYDSEFRFDAPPIPALAGLDNDGCVAYIGTFSKVLTPALRLGYLIAPAPLRSRITQLKILSDLHPSWPAQRALLALIRDGHLDRHIRRMRRFYAEKRALLSATLASIQPLAHLRGLEAGLHAYLELRPDLDAKHISQMAYQRGVVCITLDRFYHATPDRSGLLLGYGGLELAEIAQGARILADVIREYADTQRTPYSS
jgi:GntR family transcriptional regulator/MocR family aminotransferase